MEEQERRLAYLRSTKTKVAEDLAERDYELEQAQEKLAKLSKQVQLMKMQGLAAKMMKGRGGGRPPKEEPAEHVLAMHAVRRDSAEIWAAGGSLRQSLLRGLAYPVEDFGGFYPGGDTDGDPDFPAR